MGTDYLDDNKFIINDNNLELTTTWTTITTKTTRPLATVSPLDVVIVLIVVVKRNRWNKGRFSDPHLKET